MKWRKYTIHTVSEAEEAVTAMLSGLGIEGIEIEDYLPVAPEDSGNMFGDVVPEMPEGDNRAGISFYVEIPEEPDDGTGTTDSASGAAESGVPLKEAELLWNVREKLEEMRAFIDIGEGRISRSETEDKEWINKWKEYFHRFFVDDIEIIPSWEEAEPDQGASMV
ncbi:MAG: 50S ribosomal protein L11 methyltransferase, partial [Lachnospiraceae bacterium]|nr:50S ribosomal protein L11 methyltransferase [Lachnospiraceae bacterium]